MGPVRDELLVAFMFGVAVEFIHLVPMSNLSVHGKDDLVEKRFFRSEFLPGFFRITLADLSGVTGPEAFKKVVHFSIISESSTPILKVLS